MLKENLGTMTFRQHTPESEWLCSCHHSFSSSKWFGSSFDGRHLGTNQS